MTQVAVDRRVVRLLLASLVVLLLGIAAASLGPPSELTASAPPDTGVGDVGGDPATSATGPAARQQLATSALGPAAGEATDRPVRWWFAAWRDPVEAAANASSAPAPDVPAGQPEPDDGQATVASGPIVDEADVRVDAADAVARRSPEGFLVAAGSAAFGTGPEVTYTVEVEPAVGADVLAVTAAVEQALGDPRSWSRERRFVRVDDPAGAAVRVVLATPATVDRLCAEVGLRTVGRYSCWTGRMTALNAWRWAEGAAAFEDLTTYRRYLVNHEVGHALGYGHVGCPAAGALAPVMMQQSMGTDGCIANGWPYP